MIFKSIKSQNMQPERVGISDGQLKPCGPAPNCVSSVNGTDDSQHYIDPILVNSPEALELKWMALKKVLPQLKIKIEEDTETYLRGTATTPFLRFVDDVEFHKRPEQNRIDLKSVSRVGYSDLGANRKRLQKIVEGL